MLIAENIDIYIKQNNGVGTYLLRDQGSGNFIAEWNLDIPEPTVAELKTIDVQRKIKPKDKFDKLLDKLVEKSVLTQEDVNEFDS